ncbi:protein of unknown function [Methylorubrum extorquens]|uniref:Uncharacterized protein n=1 Tax=Methylorubrum extorquens TaxID=408 RepID=A0A2N9AN81_METEX|nr:protein of unknown function [Methylorubrum extorquens]
MFASLAPISMQPSTPCCCSNQRPRSELGQSRVIEATAHVRYFAETSAMRAIQHIAKVALAMNLLRIASGSGATIRTTDRRATALHA